MRISNKLTLSLTTIGILVFLSYGWYVYLVEKEDLQLVVKQQTDMLSKSLQISIEHALRDKQLEDIDELLKGLEQIELGLSVQILDPLGNTFPRQINTSYPSNLRALLYKAMQQNDKSTQFFYPADKPEFIAMSLPLHGENAENIGHLILVRHLIEMRRDLDATLRNFIISLIVFVVISVPLCNTICLIFIGWPLNRLIQGMKQVKEGNYTQLNLKTESDEIALLLSAFNAMALELDKARSSLNDETQSRIRLQSALQDADKLITIGQLSAGLAHEIGSPLQILKGRAEQLLVCANQPNEVIRHAGILVSQTERITRIVQQLLKFTRRRPTHFTLIDIRLPIKAVLNLLEYEAQRKQIILNFKCKSELPKIVADTDGIQQLVLNLVTNALAATPAKGSIDITVEIVQAALSNNHKIAADALRLSVIDNGYGMSAEVLNHLFEPFFTTRHEQGGVGLGLAVARSIVIAHGGVIKAESTPRQGSVFTVILPINGEMNDLP